MSSSDAESAYSPEHRRTLLDVASSSIEHGLFTGQALAVVTDDFPAALGELRATFVTLRIVQRLRGCMGSLQASEPLIVNVARNAFMAAFRDPRFSPLARDEFPDLHMHLSILSRPEGLLFESEEQLLSLIRPGIDGLTLIEGSRRGTLLPSVWESLDNPREFLSHLKRKAGLADDYWSTTLRVERYTAESIGKDP